MRLTNLHNTQDPVFFVLFFSFKKGIFLFCVVFCCFSTVTALTCLDRRLKLYISIFYFIC